MKKLMIIVPCYSKEAVIEESYRHMKEVLIKLPNPTEIIYMNDDSQDKTRSLLDHIAATDPHVRVIHFSRNFGHQPAVTAGTNNCDADLTIIVDASMQNPPKLTPDLLEVQERENANVVYCVRKSRERESLFKLFTSKASYRVMNYMNEVHFPLDTGDFRLVDRKVMNESDHFKERGKYVRGLVSWVGFYQVPFYCERKARIADETKYSTSKVLEFASAAILYSSKKSLRLATSLGSISILVGMILAAWFMLGKIYGFGNAEVGQTSVMTSIVFFRGAQLLTIGMLGRYAGILFDRIKTRPEYITDEKKNY